MPTASDLLFDDRMVARDGAALHVRAFGLEADRGDWITLLPGAGRGVEDYLEERGSPLATLLTQAGLRVALIQPRGQGASTGELSPSAVSMQDFALDVSAGLDALGIGAVHMVGHAFGNRLARTFATLFPERIASLALMAAGGNFTLSGHQIAVMQAARDRDAAPADRLRALRQAYFAEGSDPGPWADGSSGPLARAQTEAAARLGGEFFKRAGGLPFLLLQGAEDFVAPPDLAGRALKAELGDQVTYAEIPFCGHAMASEQPEIIASLIVQNIARARRRAEAHAPMDPEAGRR